MPGKWKTRALAFLTAGALLVLAGCGLPGKAKEAKARGQELLLAGDYAAAAEAFREASENTGHASKKYIRDLLEWQADAEFCSGDYAAAEKTWRELLTGNEKSAEYHYYLAAAEAGQGKAPEALADYRSAVLKDKQHSSFETPGCLTAFRMTEQALWDAELAGEGAELCNEEFRADADHAEVYNRAGMWCMAAEDYEKAREMFVKGQEKLPAGDTEEEKAAAEICGRELARNLAVLSENTGDYRGALDAFYAYRDRFGTDEETDREIRFLESRVQ